MAQTQRLDTQALVQIAERHQMAFLALFGSYARVRQQRAAMLTFMHVLAALFRSLMCYLSSMKWKTL